MDTIFHSYEKAQQEGKLDPEYATFERWYSNQCGYSTKELAYQLFVSQREIEYIKSDIEYIKNKLYDNLVTLQQTKEI